MRIFQILPTLAFGDGVGNDVMAMDNILRSEGYETAIAAESVIGYQKLARTGAKILAFDELAGETDFQPDDILIYHLSTGSLLNKIITGIAGRKVIVYHNITPPEFFAGYDPGAEGACRTGLEQAKNIAPYAEYCLADSSFNKKDLEKMGYICPIDVLPIIIPYDDYKKKPDPKILSEYSGDGYTNLLFVGRVSPNKKQEDIIQAFYEYQKSYNPKSRLFLVGREGGPYTEYLHDLVKKLGVKNVEFIGHVSFEGILAYYRLADLFVCMSEHEGFCIPLIEAMIFQLPILAYKSSAVPDTLGEGGVLIDNKNPEYVASCIQKILSDSDLRKQIVEKQKIQLDRFEPENVQKEFLQDIRKFMKTEPLKRTDKNSQAFHNMENLYELFCKNLTEQCELEKRELMPFELFHQFQSSYAIVVNLKDLLPIKDKLRFLTEAYWMLLERAPEDAIVKRAGNSKTPIDQYQRELVNNILHSIEYQTNEVIAIGDPWKDQISAKQSIINVMIAVFRKLPKGLQDRIYKAYMHI